VVAIWQIVRVKRAADAARDAALGLARRVRSRELLAKLGDAHTHLDAARNHVARGEREIAILCLELSCSAVIEAQENLTELERERRRLAGTEYLSRAADGAGNKDAGSVVR
jgi:hypothetical protein